jgi:FMN phosphatase YigB (HAD superfamily)
MFKRKKAKTLVVFDLDNTLSDTQSFWCAATWSGIESLCDAFAIPEAKMLASIHAAPAQYRYADFGSLIDWLDANGHLPPPASPAAKIERDAVKWALRQEWFRLQKKMSVFYPGALETLKDLKKQGVSVALHTDAEASSMIRRLWLIAYNARRGGAVKDEHEILDLFDHFYCQPSIEDDQKILRDADLSFVLKMKHKTTIWRDNIRKPKPDHTKIILEDFRTRPKHAIMVGDTDKDGGAARPLGVDFAWYYKGADVDPEMAKTADRISTAGYLNGAAAIGAAFTKASAPTHTVKSDLREMFGMFAFAPGNKFSGADYNAQSGSASPRTGASPEAQNHPAHRLAPLFRILPRRSPLGPPTHLPPKP